jgi:hypothetical protein
MSIASVGGHPPVHAPARRAESAEVPGGPPDHDGDGDRAAAASAKAPARPAPQVNLAGQTLGHVVNTKA